MSRHGFELNEEDSSAHKGTFFYERSIEGSIFLVIVQRNRYAPEFRITLEIPMDSEERYQLKGHWQWPVKVTPDGLKENDYWLRIDPLSDLPAQFVRLAEVFKKEFPGWLSRRLEALSNPAERRADLDWE